MAMEVNQDTQIIVGVIAAVAVLCVIGLCMWLFCKKAELRRTHEQREGLGKYGKIHEKCDDDQSDRENSKSTSSDTESDIEVENHSTIAVNGDEQIQTEMVPILSHTEAETETGREKQDGRDKAQHVVMNVAEDETDEQTESLEIKFAPKQREYSQVQQWFDDKVELEECNKDKYYDLFINHDYNHLDKIAHIHDYNLQQMGIENRKHRKQLIVAISSLKQEREISEEEEEEEEEEESIQDLSSSDKDDEYFSVLSYFRSDPIGNMYNDTVDFDHSKYLTQIIDNNQINISRIHLSKIIYWKSHNLLHGIQCEWNLYNNDGKIIKTFQSEANFNHMKNRSKQECHMEFNDYFYDPISINTGNYVNSLNMTTDLNGVNDTKIFGGHGGGVCIH